MGGTDCTVILGLVWQNMKGAGSLDVAKGLTGSLWGNKIAKVLRVLVRFLTPVQSLPPLMISTLAVVAAELTNDTRNPPMAESPWNTSLDCLTTDRP